jgi:hypothetical protein
MRTQASLANRDLVQHKVFLVCFCGSSLQTLVSLIQSLLIIQLYFYILRWYLMKGID